MDERNWREVLTSVRSRWQGFYGKQPSDRAAATGARASVVWHAVSLLMSGSTDSALVTPVLVDLVRTWPSDDGGEPDWDAVPRAREDELAALLLPAGFNNLHAGWIKRFLAVVHERFAESSLECMHGWSTVAIREFFEGKHQGQRIEGFGTKTVDCLLLYCFGRIAFGRDVHVARFLRRMGYLKAAGLYPEDCIFREAVDELESIKRTGTAYIRATLSADTVELESDANLLYEREHPRKELNPYRLRTISP